MYAVGHTMQNIHSLSTEGERKIREQQAKSKKKFKGVFYRCVIKNEVFSFVESYEEACGVKALLLLGGDNGK